MTYAIAGLALVGGVAYYFNLIPGLGRGKTVDTPPGSVAPAKAVEETPVKEKPVEEIPVEVAPIEVAPVESDPVEKEPSAPAEEPAPAEAPAVIVEQAEEVVPKETNEEVKESTEENAVSEPVSSGSGVVAAPAEATEEAPTEIPRASVDEAVKELSTEEEVSRTLDEAHKALRANLHQSLFKDLDDLSSSELKIRVVQLAAELGERTKWEAVRLKEFLAMKERETSEKYIELMQQQRLELEALLAKKLREQEDVLSRQANAALQQKEDAIQGLVKATTDAQAKEYEAQLVSTHERLEVELSAKFEAEAAKKLAEAKSQFMQELETKVAAIQELSAKVKELGSALDVSRSFVTGSLRAHRMSAAALALADKLESSEGAASEVAALESVGQQNSVISSAVASIPTSVKDGIPTLSELQTQFDVVHIKARQAALVPEGRPGLDGQIMGIVFSTVKYAPNPEDPVPEESANEAEYVLSRARRHVQLGELEPAVEQLGKLKGQPAFTVRDWKQKALDRIAATKALHVIKLECALMNESMSVGSASD